MLEPGLAPGLAPGTPRGEPSRRAGGAYCTPFTWCTTLVSATLPAAWQSRQVSTFLASRPERSVVLVPGTPGVAPVIDDTDFSRMPPLCLEVGDGGQAVVAAEAGRGDRRADQRIAAVVDLALAQDLDPRRLADRLDVVRVPHVAVGIGGPQQVRRRRGVRRDLEVVAARNVALLAVVEHAGVGDGAEALQVLRPSPRS